MEEVIKAGLPPQGAVLIQPMPLAWRLALGAAVLAMGASAYLLRDQIGARGQAAFGVLCFLGLIAALSHNLRYVNWGTIGWGIGLQVLLGLFIIKFKIADYRPGYMLFEAITDVVKKLLNFTSAGSRFVFGSLADPEAMNKVFPGKGFVFAFSALPTIIFIASFFTVLYYFGILQLVVRFMARIMMYFLRTSGAETLSVSANVFVGQTEAPIIVKPYVERMTRSELLTLMVSGMAHTSGGLFAVYMELKADPVALLATSVMAAPCSLYLTKLMLPELGQPETLGQVKTVVERQHVNAIDAASAGAADGIRLAINIAAMLIAFLAFIALFDSLLQAVHPELTLRAIFSRLFAPAAFLMGVESKDVPQVANLLGTKLVANELVAYVDFKEHYAEMSERSRILTTYALTGFANFASIGIQLGGIGGLAPSRRQDLARLGGRALLVGFVATLINAAIAGMLL